MAASELVDRLLTLWNNPPSGDGARAAFLALYTDPVRINGAEMKIDDLVLRAQKMGVTLTNRSTEVLSVLEGGDQVAVAFRIVATHSGPIETPLGDVPATGKKVSVQVIDVLRLEAGRIREIWMVADTFGQLLQLDALALRSS